MNFDYNFEKEIPNFIEYRNNGNFFIPKELMKIKELTINEKIYFSIYLNFNKDIEKANDYFSTILSKQSIKNIKKHLIELKYIKLTDIAVISAEEAKKLTIEKSHKGLTCEWCTKESYILHEHHYPISKSNGGTNTVKICPNCHYTFHKIINDSYYKEVNNENI